MKLTKAITAHAAAAAVLIGMAIPVNAADVTLRYSNWLPINYFLNKEVMQPWFDEIERVTEGRVVVEATPKVVGTVPGQYDVVADGLADIGFVLPGYTPGRFPLVEGFELPFLGDDATTRCPAVWNAYEKFVKPTGTFSEVVLLGLYCTNAGQIAMADLEIKSVGDLKGMKIRTPAPAVTKALELLEAIPVSKPASEIYELASGGVIDGAIIPLDSMVDFKLDGPLKKVNVIPGGMVSTVVVVPINKAAWARISPKDQEAILSVSGLALANLAGRALGLAAAKASDTLTAAGVEIITTDASVVAAIREQTAPVRDNWIADASKAGLADPAGMLDFIETQANPSASN